MVVPHHAVLLGFEVGPPRRVHRGRETLEELMPVHHRQPAHHNDALVRDVLNVVLVKGQEVLQREFIQMEDLGSLGHHVVLEPILMVTVPPDDASTGKPLTEVGQ